MCSARSIFRTCTTLIIDDEGDQAGLNTLVNQGDESTTYRRLLDLKAILPRHSYLQYTATPQGAAADQYRRCPLPQLRGDPDARETGTSAAPNFS